MQVSCSEDIASHTGPESWRGYREVILQALTGERAGWVLSREIVLFRGADGFPLHEKQNRRRRYRETLPDPARSKTPCTHGNILRGTREIPSLAPPCRRGPRGESEWSTAAMNDDGKSDKLIVPAKGSNKSGSGIPCGGEPGGKGFGQGKHGSAKQPLDTVPITSEPYAGPGTQSLRNASLPKAGARCGNSARRDLCGGRGATRVPTATDMD